VNERNLTAEADNGEILVIIDPVEHHKSMLVRWTGTGGGEDGSQWKIFPEGN
jgi:hypothetical protein